MFALFAVFVLSVSSSFADAYRISCYYRNNQRGIVLNQQALENINCTHIIFSFATVGNDFRVNLSDVGEREGLKEITQIIKSSPKRKAMLSIGGGGTSNQFDLMVARDQNINTFVSSLIELVRETSLDGVDYDWEFPSLLQQDDFSRLLERTREGFDNITKNNNRERLELSAALPGPATLTVGYNVETLKKTCTFLNVMTYDLVLYSSWRPATAFHNALYGQGNLFNPLRVFSVQFSMDFWVNLGVPANMLLLGLPTYGVAYELQNPRKAGLFAPVTGYSRFGSNINYDKICEIVNANPKGYYFDEQSRVPYATDGNGTWVSFDNARSIVEKVHFAAKSNYGGIMIFSLNADDPFGHCSLDCSQGSETCSKQTRINTNSFPLTQVATAAWNESPNKSS